VIVFALGVVAYLAVGLGAYALMARVVPENLFTDVSRYACGYCYCGRCQTARSSPQYKWSSRGAVYLAWPIFLAFTAADVVHRASEKAHTGRVKFRAELERELAAARAEVDELLGRKP